MGKIVGQEMVLYEYDGTLLTSVKGNGKSKKVSYMVRENDGSTNEFDTLTEALLYYIETTSDPDIDEGTVLLLQKTIVATWDEVKESFEDTLKRLLKNQDAESLGELNAWLQEAVGELESI